MSLKDSHGVLRTELSRLGLFWKPSGDGELEVVICGSIKSKHARAVMTSVVAALGRFAEMIEDLRIGSHKFVSRHEWVNDKERSGCNLCMRNFHTWRRKHHCRMCGEVICSDCSMIRVVPLAIVGPSKLRLCKACLSRSKNTPIAREECTVMVAHPAPSVKARHRMSVLRKGPTA